MATVSVSDTLECCICFENLGTPKVLPCGHTFCLCCLERCIADKIETFPCPICKQDVKIPEGGAKDFITNFAVQTQPKCPIHNQKMKLYCKTCNVGVCTNCILKQHRDHEILDIECREIQKIIQNRIKNFNKPRSTLESFDQLESEEKINKVEDKEKEIEKQGESMKNNNLCIQYLQGQMMKDFRSNQLGSVVSKSYVILFLYQFVFNVSDIRNDDTRYYSKNKFRNNDLIWRCVVGRFGGDLFIGIKLLLDDNPKLNYCIIDGQISLLNNDDDSKHLTETVSDIIFGRGCKRSWNLITWSELNDENTGYLINNKQFVIQLKIKHIREIDFVKLLEPIS